MNVFLTILGSGAALPTGNRRCSAQVLNIRGFKLLIDCAEGTQDRIRQSHIKLQSLNTIIISHLHGDHFFGLQGLLSTMHLCGRTEPVTIIAPLGAREVIETTFRLTGNHVEFPLEWHEMDFCEGEQRVFENKFCSIDAFPIPHSVPTYGFRISEVPRQQNSLQSTAHTPLTYSYCCDTAYDENIIPHIQNSDLLCLECTFANELAELADQRKHLTAGQAGRLAKAANVRQLLLTHISARYREPDILLQQSSAEFENCIIATDGARIELGKSIKTQTPQLADRED